MIAGKKNKCCQSLDEKSLILSKGRMKDANFVRES